MRLPGPAYRRGEQQAWKDQNTPGIDATALAAIIVDVEGWTWYASGYWNATHQEASA